MSEIFKNIVYMARRFKWTTVFNMIGLVVSFVTLYLLMIQVIYEATYNHGLKDYERLYRIESDFAYNEWDSSDAIGRPIADMLDSFPQVVEAYSLMIEVSDNFSGYYTYTFHRDSLEWERVVTYGNNKVITALNDNVVDGSIEWNESDSTGCIIPASFAREYFGTTKAAGDSVIYSSLVVGNSERQTIKVRGVYEDFPENCQMKNYIYCNILDAGVNSLNFTFQCIVKFKEVPTDLDAFSEAIKQVWIKNLLAREGSADDDKRVKLEQSIRAVKEMSIKFTPLAESYFRHETFTSADNGYRGMTSILKWACLLVILIATINFLNFTLAESPMRMRSLNTRLVLGASRQSLRMGLVAECVVTSVVACLVALALCWLLSGIVPFDLLTKGSTALGDHLWLILFMLGVSVVVGIVAGIYPALFATSIPPIIALKASFGLTPQGHRLRTILVCLQLAISMFLLFYVGILFMQSRYILNEVDYGYDKNRILTAALPVNATDSVISCLGDDLMKIPGVESVAFTDALLGSTDAHNTVHADWRGESVCYSVISASADFIKTMGIKMIAGRDFTASDELSTAAIVNKSTLSSWDGLKLGDKISIDFDEESTDSAVIVGVCDDIRYGTARIGNNQPFVILLDNSYTGYYLNLRVAANGRIDEVKAEVNKLLRRYFSHKATKLSFYDKAIERAYRNEFRYSQLIYYLCIICLVMTLIGVACLTMFETEHRRKEIGIRKASGAKTGEIVMMFCRYYGWILLISFVVALPVALFSRHLTFSYLKDRDSIHWWIFPLAFLLVAAVTLGTVALQSWRAGRENPTSSLKTE